MSRCCQTHILFKIKFYFVTNNDSPTAKPTDDGHLSVQWELRLGVGSQRDVTDLIRPGDGEQFLTFFF